MQHPLTTHTLPAPLNALAWCQPHGQESLPTLAIAGGNGQVHLWRPGQAAPLAITVNPNSAMLNLCTTAEGFYSGTDTGQLYHITTGGEITPLPTTNNGFTPVEPLTSSTYTKSAIFGNGRRLGLASAFQQNVPTAVSQHIFPSTITGIALSPLAPRAAVSHYGGASIVDLANPKNQIRSMPWKGSHTAITYAPNGKWLITAMQENTLHLWRLSDGQDLQMRGYPNKITQFSWSFDGKWLATNGGSGVPLWNFSNAEKGPAGQQAKVVAESGSTQLAVTSVAMHPKGPFLAVGYADGLALLTQYEEDKAILLKTPDSANNHNAIQHITWSPCGMHLAFTSQSGHLHTLNFQSLATP